MSEMVPAFGNHVNGAYLPQNSLAIHMVGLAGSQETYGDLGSAFGFGGGQSLSIQLRQGIDDRTVCNQRIMKNPKNDLDGKMREPVLANSREAGASSAPLRVAGSEGVMGGNRVGPRNSMLSQKSLQMHILIFQLPVLSAQGGIEKNLALLLLISAVPRDLKIVRPVRPAACFRNSQWFRP